jgi:putative MATE family efflux protein
MTEPTEQITVETPPERVEPHGIWAGIRDALRGSEHDYTQGSIPRAIALLSIPMMLEMGMESLFALTDIFFVAKLGADSIATVGLTESLLGFVYAIAIGLAIGVTAMVARRIGEKNPEAAAEAAVQGVILGILVAAILGTIGVIFAEPLLRLVGADDNVVKTGLSYTRIMLGGEVSVILLFVVNAAFRGAGDAAIAMRVLILANSINIVLGPLLIFGIGPFPKLGVTGAAIATTIGRSTGALFAIYKLLHKDSRLRVRRQDLRVVPEVLFRLTRLCASGVFQFLIGTASWIGIVRIVATFGNSAIAGYTIGIRVIIFAILPAMGISNAAATMVGQSLGAGNPARAEESVWKAARYSTYFLGSIGIVFFLFAPAIVSTFAHDAEVTRYAADCLRVVAGGFFFYGYGMVLTQSFNGAGDTWTPTWLNFAVFWVWEIPLAYVLSHHANMGPHGVFVAMAVAFSTLAVASAVLFKRGKWKTKTV